MEYAVTPGVHKLEISYPPYYFEGINEMAEFDQEGQTFKVVLQLTPEGEAQRNRTLDYDAKLLVLEKSKHELEKTKMLDKLEYERKKLALAKDIEALEREKRESCDLFQKQLKLADAMLERYKRSGAADDYVRKTIAEGTAVYWKNSFGRVAITDGKTDNIEMATPATDVIDLVVPPSPQDISDGLKKILKKGSR